MFLIAFSRRGRSRRERLQQDTLHRPAVAPVRAACPRPEAEVGLADVRLGSLGLALERRGSFAEWMRKDAA